MRSTDLLGALRLHPEICVPVLIKGLEETLKTDTNGGSYWCYAGALLQFRKTPQAQAALPILTQAAQSTNSFISHQSKWLLDCWKDRINR